jgi:hypothetical protein
MGRIVAVGAVLAALAGVAVANPSWWKSEWQRTDFTKHSVDLDDIISGGVRKDGIPSIDAPTFVAVAEVDNLGETEPVIAVSINGESRAYPLRILTWHEIVNDTVGGIPVTVTYCPLCNSSIVFDRRVRGQVLDFGTTGKLRNSDLVMYDRQTESWWQQFLGEAIVGEMTGESLTMIPSRVESRALPRTLPRGPGSRPKQREHSRLRDQPVRGIRHPVAPVSPVHRRSAGRHRPHGSRGRRRRRSVEPASPARERYDHLRRPRPWLGGRVELGAPHKRHRQGP